MAASITVDARPTETPGAAARRRPHKVTETNLGAKSGRLLCASKATRAATDDKEVKVIGLSSRRLHRRAAKSDARKCEAQEEDERRSQLHIDHQPYLTDATY
jgi:hypothetical protein